MSDAERFVLKPKRLVIKPEDVVLVYPEDADSDWIHELWLELLELGLLAVVYDPEPT